MSELFSHKCTKNEHLKCKNKKIQCQCKCHQFPTLFDFKIYRKKLEIKKLELEKIEFEKLESKGLEREIVKHEKPERYSVSERYL